MKNQNEKGSKAAKAVAEKAAPEAAPVKIDKQVFEGTVAGQKFLFLADQAILTPVAEVLPGETPEEIALKNSAEIVARAQANHEAVKALIREWVKAKKAAKASSPEAIAAKAEKLALKERAKADRAAAREAKAAEKKAEREAVKAAVAKAKADAVEAAAKKA